MSYFEEARSNDVYNRTPAQELVADIQDAKVLRSTNSSLSVVTGALSVGCVAAMSDVTNYLGDASAVLIPVIGICGLVSFLFAKEAYNTYKDEKQCKEKFIDYLRHKHDERFAGCDIDEMSKKEKSKFKPIINGVVLTEESEGACLSTACDNISETIQLL